MDYKRDLGLRIKALRKSFDYTQEELAEKLNISIKHYSSVERGLSGLSISNLILLCEILGTDLNFLVLGKKETDQDIPDRLKEIYLKCPEGKRKYLIKLWEDAIRIGDI